MAEIISYDYTTGSDPASAWTNPANAYDGSSTTYASRTIAINTDETTKYLLFSAFVGTIPNWNITKVEIGIRHLDNVSGTAHVHFKAMFDGETSGPVHELAHSGTAVTTYTDITNDAGISLPWLGLDVTELDIQAWFHNPDASTRACRIYEVYVRITCTALYYATAGNAITADEFSNSVIDNPPWTESYQIGGSAVEGVDTLVVTAGQGTVTDTSWQPSGIYQAFAAGDFDIQLKISDYGTISSTLCLACYIDASNYAYVGMSGADWIYGFKGGGGSGSGTSTHGSPKPAYIRLTRVGTVWTYWSSTDGITWTSRGVATYLISTLAGSCWISVNKGAGVSFTGTFDWIHNGLAIFIINVYLDNADMTHYLGMQFGNTPLYAKVGAVGVGNQSRIRVQIDGSTYSLLADRS